MSSYDFVFHNDREVLEVIFYDDKGNKTSSEELTQGVVPLGVNIDVDTGIIVLRLRALFRDREVVKEITVENLQANNLSSLLDFGFPFSDSFVRKYVSAWLMEEIETLNLEEVTKQLGWKDKDNESYFQLSRSISEDGDVDVKYNGDLLIKKAGTWSEYKEFLNELVLPYIQLQAIVAFSAASALATILGDDLTLIVHLKGETSTGKTTALKLGASVWSDSRRMQNGIHQTWNTTNAALINGLCGIVGLTLCYDELGATDNEKKADFLSLVYKLSMGIEKRRMNFDNNSPKFAVNILSSGEIPMKDVDSVNGADVRLLEISCPMTDSKEHSESIDAALSSCYGHLGERFVKVLVHSSKEKLTSLYVQLCNKILHKYDERIKELTDKNQRIFARSVKKIAVIALSAYIMKKRFGLNFQYMKIADFFIKESAFANKLDDEATRMIEDFMHEREDSEIDCETRRIPGSMGDYRIRTTNDIRFDKSYISIPKTQFYDLLKRCGYNRKKVEENLQILRERGVLHCEKGKLYNRRQLDTVKKPYIEFSIEKLNEEGVDYKLYNYGVKKGDDKNASSDL